MATQLKGNGVVARILASFVLALIVGFLAGRYGFSDLENRVRTNEKVIERLDANVEWIRDALEKKGFTP